MNRYKTVHQEYYVTRGDFNGSAPIITDSTGVIVATAARFAWAKGKPWKEVQEYLAGKNYTVKLART